jgi:hypothetical protein
MDNNFERMTEAQTANRALQDPTISAVNADAEQTLVDRRNEFKPKAQEWRNAYTPAEQANIEADVPGAAEDRPTPGWFEVKPGSAAVPEIEKDFDLIQCITTSTPSPTSAQSMATIYRRASAG